MTETKFLKCFEKGRSGRAGRAGEAITIYTEDDVPYLRNVANVVAASGCEVPSWIMALPKLKWKKHRPRRDSISTNPKDEKESDEEKEKKKKTKMKRKKKIKIRKSEAAK